jgi:cyclomaltodextrinase / maltogenic alpha-amylase / neopullulanase
MIQKGKYKHYKGKYYEVIGVGRHSETLEDMVIYKALYQEEGGNLWVRPIKMFTEEVDVNGIKKPRFEYLGG